MYRTDEVLSFSCGHATGGLGHKPRKRANYPINVVPTTTPIAHYAHTHAGGARPAAHDERTNHLCFSEMGVRR